jgi:hypothetical protein
MNMAVFAQSKHGLLQVTTNGHYLQYADGTPFFWLGDTGWELFHRLTLEEIEKYLDNRQDKGFNVIQAVILAELDGLRVPNKYGHVPFIDMNPDQPNEEYFTLVDSVVQLAEDRNMIMALLPTWGDKVTLKYGGSGPVVFTPENAYRYGLFLGKRYKDKTNIVWVLGGDRPPQDDKNDWKPVYAAMAKGLDDGTEKHFLKSFHPGGYTWETAPMLHQQPWLDFNMNQSGHTAKDQPVWKTIERDWAMQPTKPTLDGEPCYEDHPLDPWRGWTPAKGYFRDYDVRKQLYRSVFAGAFGVTFGHHAIWQFYNPSVEKLNYADRYWYEALDRPGAYQEGYLRKLMESRPCLNRVPDQNIIKGGQGEKGEYITAFRDEEGRYLMVYLPVGKKITIDATSVKSKRVECYWYNPKNTETKYIGQLKKKNSMQFIPPTLGIGNDWVLVVDNTSMNYGIPGK